MLVSAGRGPFNLRRRLHAFVLQRGNAARINRLGHQRDRNAQVLRIDDRPFAGAFLAGGVENLVHERRAVGVLERQNVARDFDEIGIQFALVPFGENLVHFRRAHAEAVFQNVVGLADQLHVAVFDAVVNHLHVMARAAFAHPVAARHIAFHFRGDALENILHVRPRGGRTAGHDARAMTRAFFAAAHAGADVKQSFALDIFHAAVGVLEKRIAAVNDDVARFEMRQELFDEFVHGFAGLDEHHHAARLLELGNHFFDGMRADDFCALGFVGEEVVHLFRRCG